jgi:Protein of unknown function (DUF3455)
MTQLCKKSPHYAAALISMATLSAASIASASPGAPPASVPAGLEIPAGHSLLLRTTASGVQTYDCIGGAWSFRSPRAEVFEDFFGAPVISHYGGIDRGLNGGPWWESNRDGSRIRGGNAVSAPSARPNSITQLRVQVLERSGTGLLSDVSWIHRLNTVGGVAPTGACTTGQRFDSPYTTDYYFYTPGDSRPQVPEALAIPADQKLLLKTSAKGFQRYECVRGTWTFRSPIALLKDSLFGYTSVGHFGGVDFGLPAGPYWQSFSDGSSVRGGNAVAAPSPNAGSIPLLRVQVVAKSGNGFFNRFNWIHRLNTRGGLSPTGRCHHGRIYNSLYTTDYYFYGD